VPGRDGVSVDQGAIRGSRRSNPATYIGLLDPIRKAFANYGDRHRRRELLGNHEGLRAAERNQPAVDSAPPSYNSFTGAQV
jgi:hypothetical protein